MINLQNELQYSFYETSVIIENMPKEYEKKLPEKLKKFLNENKLKNNFTYNNELPLDKQEMLADTKTLLSILYRTYWRTKENKKEFEQKELQENEANNIVTLHNTDELFPKNKQEEVVEEKNALVQYKPSLIKRMIDKIKKIFNYKN